MESKKWDPKIFVVCSCKLIQKDEKYFLLLTLFFKDSKEEKKIEMRLEEYSTIVNLKFFLTLLRLFFFIIRTHSQFFHCLFHISMGICFFSFGIVYSLIIHLIYILIHFLLISIIESLLIKIPGFEISIFPFTIFS